MAFGGLKGTLTGNGNSITASNSIAGSVVVNVGDLVFATITEQTSLTATTASDNLGNTYTAQNAGTLSSTVVSGRSYWSRITVAGTLTSVTVVATSSTHDWAGFAAVIEGPFLTSPLDANPANTTTSITSPFSCPATGTLAQTKEVVIAWGVANQSTAWAAVSPNSLAGNAANSTSVKVSIGSQVVSSTTTVTPQFSSVSNPTNGVQGTASFKGAPALPFGQTTTDVVYPKRGAVGDAFGWNDQSIINFIIPFAQSDWPNPNRPLPQPLTWVDAYPNRGAGGVQAPFHQNDWPTPRGVNFTQGWIDSYPNRTSTQSGPRNQTDWPNPIRIPAAVVTDFVDQSIIGLIIPFSQTDWPNPVRSPVTPLEFHDTFNRPVVTQNPFKQNDWPNPRGIFVPVSVLGSINGPIVATQNPFSQQNWPNPTRANTLAQGWTDTYNRPVIAVQFPFGNKNYDLPPRAHRPNQGWTDSYPNRAAIVQVPFFSNSIFDVPRGPTSTEPGFVDQAIFAFTIPFSKTDWPNPRGPTWSISQLGSIDGVIVVEPQPFSQADWPNPTTRQPTISGWVDSYPNRVAVVSIPFKQNDWNNPQTKNAIPVYWIDTYSNRTPSAPFAQLNWTNPATRQSSVLGWIDSYANRTPAAPFFQNYWQNPQVKATLPVYWIDTYNRTPPLIPFSQSDWPNPQRNIVLPFWWTDSYNRTPPVVGNPFSQLDWPNPKGPTATHAVGIIPYATVLIPIPPPPPPSDQPDWKPFLSTVGRLSCIG